MYIQVNNITMCNIAMCKEGSTALMLAASFDLEISRLLIDKGANLNIQDNVM